MNNFIKTITRGLKKHSPELLIGAGIAGMISTVILAVKGTPKAIKIIEEKEKEKNGKLTKKEVVKETWKCYIPAAIAGTASITSILIGNKVHLARTAALATAYTLTENTLNEYKNKVVEAIGAEKEKEISEKVMADKVASNNIIGSEYVLANGKQLFFEPVTGRVFVSSINDIEKAVNRLNKNMTQDTFGYITLNELFEEIGLEPVDAGCKLGWNLEKGLIDISFGSHLTADGKACVTIEYKVEPVFDF